MLLVLNNSERMPDCNSSFIYKLSFSIFRFFANHPYSGTVIPIIFAVLCLSYIYRWVDKMLPEVLRTVFTPTISLFVARLLTLTVIGPIGIYLGNLLADFIKWIFSISPILGGIIFGAIRPIAIFTGLHHAMTPIALQNFANQGWDMLMPMMLMANMAITGATLAAYFKVKSPKEKALLYFRWVLESKNGDCHLFRLMTIPLDKA